MKKTAMIVAVNRTVEAIAASGRDRHERRGGPYDRHPD